MSDAQDDLWSDFPRTATEFEERFATEEDCKRASRPTLMSAQAGFLA
jgi:hypothetical protein